MLEIAGAGAGLVIFVNLVGGLVWRARLDALELPAESTLGLLPAETVVIAGVRLLLPSLALGVVLLFVLAFAESSTVQPGWLNARRRGALGAVAGLTVIAVTVILLEEPLTPSKQRLALLVSVVTVLLIGVVVHKGSSFKGIGATMFALIAVFSGVLGYIRASDPPVALDFAVVHTKGGGRTSGFLIARSSDAVILAPDVVNHTIRRVAAVPREDVVDLRLSPGPPRGVRPLPRYGGQTVALLPPMRGDDDTAKAHLFLKSIRGSSLWKYPPIMFNGSIGLWSGRYREFAAEHPVLWSDDGVQAPLAQLNAETNLFEGKVVITEGVLLAATLSADAEGTIVRQFVAVRAPKSPDFRAVCPVANATRDALRPGDRVQMRGIVLAAGIFVDGSGTERRRLAMVCASVRRR